MSGALIVSWRHDDLRALVDTSDDLKVAASRCWSSLGVEQDVGELSDAELRTLAAYAQAVQQRSSALLIPTEAGLPEIPAPAVDVTSNEPGPRIVRGVAVPTGVAIPIGRGREADGGRLICESIAPGALTPDGNVDGKSIPLRLDHDKSRNVGHVVSVEQHGSDYLFEAVLADTAHGRDAAALITSSSLRGVSVGFVPMADTTQIVDGVTVMRRDKLSLLEISLCSGPVAYSPHSRVQSLTDEPLAEVKAAGAARRNRAKLDDLGVTAVLESERQRQRDAQMAEATAAVVAKARARKAAQAAHDRECSISTYVASGERMRSMMAEHLDADTLAEAVTRARSYDVNTWMRTRSRNR